MTVFFPIKIGYYRLEGRLRWVRGISSWNGEIELNLDEDERRYF